MRSGVTKFPTRALLCRHAWRYACGAPRHGKKATRRTAPRARHGASPAPRPVRGMTRKYYHTMLAGFCYAAYETFLEGWLNCGMCFGEIHSTVALKYRRTAWNATLGALPTPDTRKGRRGWVTTAHNRNSREELSGPSKHRQTSQERYIGLQALRKAPLTR